MHVKLTGDVK